MKSAAWFTLQEHARAVLAPTRENRDRQQAIDKIKACLPDLEWCDVHNTIVEKKTMRPTSFYDTNCMQCPIEGQKPPISLTLDSSSREKILAGGIAAHEEIRDRWLKSVAVVEDGGKKAQAAVTINRVNEGVPMGAREEERTAFLQYTILVFDWVRLNVCRPVESRSKSHDKYTAFLNEYNRYAIQRNGLNQCSRMLCIKHKKDTAHMLPLDDGVECYKAYDATCGMCPLKTHYTKPDKDFTLRMSSARLEKAVTAQPKDAMQE